MIKEFMGEKIMQKWWMVRVGDKNELIPVWKEKGVVSIGWMELGDPKKFSTRNDLIEKASQTTGLLHLLKTSVNI